MGAALDFLVEALEHVGAPEVFVAPPGQAVEGQGLLDRSSAQAVRRGQRASHFRSQAARSARASALAAGRAEGVGHLGLEQRHRRRGRREQQTTGQRQSDSHPSVFPLAPSSGSIPRIAGPGAPFLAPQVPVHGRSIRPPQTGSRAPVVEGAEVGSPRSTRTAR